MDPKYIEYVYCKAVYTDAKNAYILRQFETFALEYDKFGRGEVLFGKCITCFGTFVCETCSLYRQYAIDLEHMPPALSGRRHTLQEIDDYMINTDKPEVMNVKVPKKRRPGYWNYQAFLVSQRLRKGLHMKQKELILPPEP